MALDEYSGSIVDNPSKNQESAKDRESLDYQQEMVYQALEDTLIFNLYPTTVPD